MRQREVEQFIEESFRDGYSLDEIQKVLSEKDVDGQKVQRAVQNLKRNLNQQNQKRQTANRNNQRTNARQNTGEKQRNLNQKRKKQSQSQKRNSQVISQEQHENIIKGIDLTEDEYTIKQRFFFNRYHVYDSSNQMVLKGKQKLFKLKENFPLMTPDGDTVARVTAEKIVDAGGDYTLKDEETDEPIAVLDRQYTLFRHKWKIRDPETEAKWAQVESANKTIELIRWLGNFIPYMPNFFGIIPHKYEIKDQNESILAKLEGQLSLRDIYKLKINNTGKVPKEALVASAIAIDALEAN